MTEATHGGCPSDTSAARRSVLVLQGGGALGSYQAGVFQALEEGGVAPDWVAGVSIGAINAALIAGNPPARRLAALKEFWHRVTAAPLTLPGFHLPGFEGVEQRLGAAGAVLFGSRGFFRPRSPLDWVGGRQVSFYDTSELRQTLCELTDFDRINGGDVRLSVGAVEVETGNMVYFDSKTMKLGPEHVMASGALPPGFPAVIIEGRAYWDGGLVSNTPLQYVLGDEPRHSSLIFQVDLFPARGKSPENLDEVQEREKDIRYSSRTRTGTNESGAQQNLRREVRNFLDRLPPELQTDPVAQRLHDYACGAAIDVVQLIYRPVVPQGSQKDYQFDRGTMERRWAQGHDDATVSLRAAPWAEPPPPYVGFRTFDVTDPNRRHPRKQEFHAHG